MNNDSVRFELSIQQVTQNVDYEGTIKIGKIEFSYKASFNIPIDQIKSELPKQNNGSPTLAQMQRLFPIRLYRKPQGSLIDITLDEYRLFFNVIIYSIIDFAENPQTIDSNKGMLGQIMNGNNELSGLGQISASIGIIKVKSYEVNDFITTTLNQEKFGFPLN